MNRDDIALGTLREIADKLARLDRIEDEFGDLDALLPELRKARAKQAEAAAVKPGVVYVMTPTREGANTTWTREEFDVWQERKKDNCVRSKLLAFVENSRAEAEKREEELAFEEAFDAFKEEQEAEDRRAEYRRSIADMSPLDRLRMGHIGWR